MPDTSRRRAYEYALVGGYALGAHGFNRFTEDVDILVDPSAENSRRWILALSRLPDAAAAEQRIPNGRLYLGVDSIAFSNVSITITPAGKAIVSALIGGSGE